MTAYLIENVSVALVEPALPVSTLQQIMNHYLEYERKHLI